MTNQQIAQELLEVLGNSQYPAWVLKEISAIIDELELL